MVIIFMLIEDIDKKFCPADLIILSEVQKVQDSRIVVFSGNENKKYKYCVKNEPILTKIGYRYDHAQI